MLRTGYSPDYLVSMRHDFTAELFDRVRPAMAFDLKTGAEFEFAWADGRVVDWKGGVATIREKRVNEDVALIKRCPMGGVILGSGGIEWLEGENGVNRNL